MTENDESKRLAAGGPETPGAHSAGPEKRASPWARLYSVDLMLWVLGLLIAVMALGTIIPQRAQGEAYQRLLGAPLGKLIAKSSLTDVFGAWWFWALFAVLAASLVACSVQRLGRLLRVGGTQARPLSSAQVRGQRSTATWNLKLGPEAAYERLTQVLQRRGYRVLPVAAEESQERALRARRGGARAWGSLVVHAGVVIVLLGAAYGRLPSRGFDRVAPIATGGTYQVEMGERSFGVRLLDAGTETTPTGEASEYWAKTQVIEHGKVVREYTIRMNRPLRHNGTNIVLSSISSAPGYAVEVTRDGEVSYLPIVVDRAGRVDFMRSVKRIGNPPWLVWVRDFRLAPAGDGSEAAPAAQVRVDESGSVSADRRDLGWVGAGGLDYKGAHFELVSAGGGTQVQLGVHRDPGVPIVWGGFILMVMGSLVAFFVTRREFAVILTPQGGRTMITVGASAMGLGPGAQDMVKVLGVELDAREEVESK
ncbi:MAG TPA: cytochrome c biogenesis protein ResB [Armatimonadota bacterium]|nr:cytochrome c biogenesis protein ResB [Armatimonadota bacterium]